MGYEFNNGTAIYLQIIDDVKEKILSGEFQKNQKIPSVRELSAQYGVNPNTIQKALFDLENAGLIITERTNGKFVTSDQSVIENIKKETITKRLNEFYAKMEKLGIDKSSVIEIIRKEQLWVY